MIVCVCLFAHACGFKCDRPIADGHLSVFMDRVFIKYCIFPENFVIFLNSVSSAAALVFYLPGRYVCTHTDTEGKQRKAILRNIFNKSEKTQCLMDTLYINST